MKEMKQVKSSLQKKILGDDHRKGLGNIKCVIHEYKMFEMNIMKNNNYSTIHEYHESMSIYDQCSFLW